MRRTPPPSGSASTVHRRSSPSNRTMRQPSVSSGPSAGAYMSRCTRRLTGLTCGYLVHPDDAAPARVVQPAFALGVRLPGQPENLRPERPGRERLGGVEADLLNRATAMPLTLVLAGLAASLSLDRLLVPVVEDLGRPRRLDPIPRLRHRATDDHRGAGSRAAGPRLRSWTRSRLATALARPGAEQPP